MNLKYIFKRSTLTKIKKMKWCDRDRDLKTQFCMGGKKFRKFRRRQDHQDPPRPRLETLLVDQIYHHIYHHVILLN
jgi:hypothetical protein